MLAGVMAIIKRIRPFHAITKISRILEALVVLMMGINRGVKEAHYLDSILKAPQEHSGDQVVEKWFLCGNTVACLQKEVKMLYNLRHSLQCVRESGSFGHPTQQV